MREVLMNEKTNLLQLEEHFYQLVDVDEPNTFRNLFPYSEVPKIAFNDRIVPHNMPELRQTELFLSSMVIQQSFQQLQHLTSHVTVWISSHSALSLRRRCTL